MSEDMDEAPRRMELAITLSQESWNTLQDVAKKEYRLPAMQASYLLENELTWIKYGAYERPDDGDGTVQAPDTTGVRAFSRSANP